MKRMEPDFERLRKALYCGEPDRVPILELYVDPSIQEYVLGRKIVTVKDTVEFHIKAGYDAVKAKPLIDMNPGKLMPKGGKRISEASGVDGERTWFNEGAGVITNWDEFERYQWPKPEDVDYRQFEELGREIPDSMMLIGQYGDIFTWVWELMGFETFSFALYENPDLVKAMFERVGEIVYNLFENMVSFDKVGALWYSDDLAFQSGLLVHPDVFRTYLFPYMKKIGDLCRERNIPYIYHSDGVLWDVLDDLLDCGIHALHPIEPQAMDIVQVKQRLAGKICVIGNVDLEYTLTRATVEEVIEKTKRLIQAVAPGGGYVLSSANSIPNYVKAENYAAMIETVRQYGWYPIEV